MRSILSALIAGIIFGGGLALSDMINPGRVLAFLDVAGAWDPTLAFVMAGAVIPTAIAFALRRRLNRPLFANAYFVPENRSMDSRLVVGATIFGIGWGLFRFCPGPAISGLVLGLWQPWLFVAMMLLGMLIERVLPLRLPSGSIAPRQA